MKHERITFWYGCNVLRHGEIIRSCLDILRKIGFDPAPVGGPDYCCGSLKDSNQTTAGGMAARTIDRFNALERDRVVAWCPSCHSHMHDFMDHANDRQFGMTYLVELLHQRREELKPLLIHSVAMRVMLHKHVGFQEYVPVNRMVPELLHLIPGVEVVEDDYSSPGYMCASFAGLPQAMQDIETSTVAAARRASADAVVTVFHQCYRELCGLEAAGLIPVYNYIHLMARSMGLPHEDEYKSWKKAGPGAAALIGAERIAQVGVQFYERAIAPELARRPKTPGK